MSEEEVIGKFKLKSFRATARPDLCDTYVDGHIKVLTDYGVANVTSNSQTWTKIHDVYCVMALDEEGEMVGAIRVQKADGENPLPVEKAIGSLDPRIHDIVGSFMQEGVGELCGLWNSKKVAGLGLSMVLTRAAISIVNQTNVGIMVGICSDHTMEMFRRVGFVVNNDLGDNGEFVYPNENYIARVLGILNARNLETADEYDRLSMLDLRDKPNQIRREKGPKGVVEIDYQLKLEL